MINKAWLNFMNHITVLDTTWYDFINIYKGAVLKVKVELKKANI